MTLVSDVGNFAIERLKTVIKNMPEFTLHDETHIFNMLAIIDKIIPKNNMKELSIPDLLMLIISVFLYDIGMAPDETYILVWKNQLSDIDSNEELEKERERFARFRLTYTHQLSDIERLFFPFGCEKSSFIIGMEETSEYKCMDNIVKKTYIFSSM